MGGGLSLRQTDPTHLRSIGQRLERLGSFIEVAKTHRRDTGVARCAPCADELVAASIGMPHSCANCRRGSADRGGVAVTPENLLSDLSCSVVPHAATCSVLQ